MTSNILSVKAIKGNNRPKRAWVRFNPTPRSNRVKRKWKPLPIKSIDKTSNNQIPYNWNDFNDFINNMKEYRKERSDWNSCFWTSRISRQGDKSSLSQIQFILCPNRIFWDREASDTSKSSSWKGKSNNTGLKNFRPLVEEKLMIARRFRMRIEHWDT